MALRTLIPMLQLIMIVIISKYGLYSLLIKKNLNLRSFFIRHHGRK